MSSSKTSLTLFTAPKAFDGHIGIIQRNALKSWAKLGGGSCQIIVFGDEPGIEQAAKEIGAMWIGQVERSQYGTPLLSSVFQQAQQHAVHERVCFINADIIMMTSFLDCVARVRREKFLMVGRRWNVDITEPVDFEAADWEQQLAKFTLENGELFTPAGIDYFVFPRGDKLAELPPFIIGRPGWDNWFIYNARRLGYPVIDATPAMVAVHQNHDYRHVPHRRDNRWAGPEADWNRQFLELDNYTFTVDDATHTMGKLGMMPALKMHYLRKRLRSLPVLHPLVKPVGRPLRRAAHRLGILTSV